MTKDAEIALLNKTIAAFGPDSYLGPWLAENRDRLVQDIRSDFPPSALLPDAAYRRGSEMMAETKVECDRLFKDAHAEAGRIKDAAIRFGMEVRAEARRALERVLAGI